MPRLSVSRKIAVLSLAAALCASWATAAPSRPEPPAIQPVVVRQIWSLWSSLWSSLPEKLDEGCHADPSGGCIARPSAAPAVTLDEGCHADPDGRCVSGS